jgi:hypothetical protein
MIDIVEIKPHTAESKIINNNVLSIFLAGTIDMGDSEDWQHEVKLRFEEFAEKNKDKVTQKNSSIHLYNPRRLESWGDNKEEMEYQVNWELDHLEKANIILMNLLPNSKSPISLLELGLFARSKKLFIICPPEFYRYDNVRIVTERYKIKLYNNIDEFFNKEMQW